MSNSALCAQGAAPSRFIGRTFGALSALLLTAITATAQCALEFQPFSSYSGTNARVHDSTIAANGDLIAVGTFTVAGGTFANRVARWDGMSWHPLGAGLDGTAFSVAEMANGDIVVGGMFQQAGGNPAPHIARWNGVTWATLGGGLDGAVRALHVAANGDLIVGGSFDAAAAPGGQALARIARWDGAQWTSVDQGVAQGSVRAIESLPNGDLAFGGTFRQVNGAAVNGLAIYDGVSWQTPVLPGTVQVLALCQEVGGDLWIGGQFIGSSVIHQLASWNGSNLTLVATPIDGTVGSILVDSTGGLVVGNSGASGASGISVARRFAGSWTTLDASGLEINTIVEHASGLVAGGDRPSLSQNSTPKIRRYQQGVWSSLGGAFDSFRALAADAQGGVYVGGGFTKIADIPADRVAHWDGNSWSALGSGLSGTVRAMTVASNGDLIVGGFFSLAGGVPASHIARWNGTNWSPLGAGLPLAPWQIVELSSGDIAVVVVDPDPIWIFDGSTWTSPTMPTTGYVESVAALPGGELAVGFWGTEQVWTLAGTTWASLGNQTVQDAQLGVAIDGRLLAVGRFSSAGVNSVGYWDGAAWQTFPMPGVGGLVHDITGMPNGDVVFAGVNFPASFGSSHLVRWDGSSWSVVGGGMGHTLGAVTRVVDTVATTSGRLFAIGDFASAGGIASGNIAMAESTCPGAVIAAGTGCTGSAGPVTLQASNLPWIGTTFRSHVTGMAPTSLALHVVGVNSVAVPLPLGGSCTLQVDPIHTGVLFPGGGVVAAPFDVPANPAFVGQVVRTQVLGLELGAGLALTSVTGSNTLELTLGTF